MVVTPSDNLATLHKVPSPAKARRIEFSRPWETGNELVYVKEVVESGKLFGAGQYNQRCEQWLEERIGVSAWLTTSATRALELAALAVGIGEGDEIVMPSFTHVATANGFVLRGATPVFVDVRPDTLNVDESHLESALSSRTRAIVAMHYGGVACEMDAILAIGRRHSIAVIEDAAQAITCSYRERPLGSLGDAACVSFDGQKNLTCGEGGALLCSDEVLVERAQTIYDGGTNRAQFVRGEVERYSWVAPGSAFRPSELTAAFLWAQLERAAEIKERRLSLWSHYWDSLAPLEEVGFLRRPHVPSECKHAGHAFWVVLGEQFERSRCLAHLHDRGIEALSHFEPLHSSLAGRTYGRMSNSMSVTEAVAPQLVRLPLHPRMEGSEVDYVVSVLGEALNF